VTQKSRYRLVLGLSLAAGLLVVAGVILLIALLIPADVDQKLADLKGTDPQARAAAVAWLAEADPGDEVSGRVTAALEPLVLGGDVRHALDPDLLLRAYLNWARRDNVPTLVRMVEHPTLPDWCARKTGQVMETLGKLWDGRAAQALAARLSDPVLHDQAASALETLGPRGEEAVLEYLFDPDPATRLRADKLLAGYGTRPKTIAAEAVDRLQSGQAEVQISAAVWFAENAPEDDMPRAQAARLLAGLLHDLSPKVNAPALRALKLWATKDSLPALVGFAQREAKAGRCDPVLLDVLARFKDPTAATAIALQLKNTSVRGEAVQALLQLGPTGAPAVLPYLNDPNAAIRKEARSLARSLNIPANRQLDQTLADVADTRTPRRLAALDNLARTAPDEANRTRVSEALNAVLLDPDAKVRDEALAAVMVWGTKENTTTLLKVLGTAQTVGPDCEAHIIAALGAIKDSGAAVALAQELTDPPMREAAGAALRSIGPAAEDAVIPFVKSMDAGARMEAGAVLAEIGTAKSLTPLREAAQLYTLDGRFTYQAEIACQKIMARKV
jgi:hypothetical protein